MARLLCAVNSFAFSELPLYAYYTVENARRSTGLGRYIAKTLTKRMDGDIRAEYGGGMLETTVSFPAL